MPKKKRASYTKRAVRGSISIIIGLVIAAFASYLFRIILARNLSVEDVGLFFGVMSVVSFLIILRSLGLNTALAKYISEFNVRKQYGRIKSSIVTAYLIQLSISIILVIILFFLSDFLAESYFKNESASLVLKLLSLLLVIGVFDDLLKRVFHGFQKMNHFSFIEAGKRVLIVILALILFNVGLDMEVLSPILAYLFSGPIIFIAFLPVMLRMYSFFKYKAKLTTKLTKKLLHFGIPALSRAFSENVVGYFDVLILIYFVSLADVGIYTIVLPTGMLFLSLSRAICLVMLPLGSEIWAKKQYKKLSEGVRRIHKYLFVLMVPIALALISYAKIFINVFFGKDYFSGLLALQIILIGVIFFSLTKINNVIIASIGKTKVVAKIILIVMAINIILDFILIPGLGINGAALATSASFILSFVLSSREASKLIKLRIPFVDLSRIFVSGAAFIVIIYVLKNLLVMAVWPELIIILIASSLAYAMLIFLFKVLTFKEIKGVIKLTLS